VRLVAQVAQLKGADAARGLQHSLFQAGLVAVAREQGDTVPFARSAG